MNFTSEGTVGRARLPLYRYGKHQLVKLPGGKVQLGFDRKEKEAFLKSTETAEGRAFAQGLVRSALRGSATVKPFLCALNVVGKDRDVVMVTAAKAQAMAKALGARLPTEAEWEFMARDGSSRSWVGRDGTLDELNEHLWELYRRPFDEKGSNDRYGLHGLAFGAWATTGGTVALRAGAALRFPWQNDDEHLDAHVAARVIASPKLTGAVRLVWDLPDELPRAGGKATPKPAASTKRTKPPKKAPAARTNDPSLIARIEALARARWVKGPVVKVSISVDCYRLHKERFTASVFCLVTKRSKPTPFGESASGVGRDGALRALIAELEAR